MSEGVSQNLASAAGPAATLTQMEAVTRWPGPAPFLSCRRAHIPDSIVPLGAAEEPASRLRGSRLLFTAQQRAL